MFDLMLRQFNQARDSCQFLVKELEGQCGMRLAQFHFLL